MSEMHDLDDPMFPYYLDEFIFNDEDKKRRQQRNDGEEWDDDETDDEPPVEKLNAVLRSGNNEHPISITRIPVQSSNLASVGYEDGILEIEFHNGEVYQYFDVPEDVYDELMDADSHGIYFHENIKDEYEWEKVEDEKKENDDGDEVDDDSHEPERNHQQEKITVPPPSNNTVPVGVGVALALFNAIKGGKLDVIRVLLRNNPKWVAARDQDGKTPLHYAVDMDNVAIVQFLIKCRADVNAKDTKGISPLRQAIQNGRLESAKCLIEYGADVNEKGKHPRDMPLCDAIRRSNIEIIKMLVEYGVDLNVKNDRGDAPLHGVTWSSIATVETLVNLGADINAKRHGGFTVLHDAASCFRDTLVETLVKLGADVHAKNDMGGTPLHSAAGSDSDISDDGNEEIKTIVKTLEQLVKFGADVNAGDNEGNTPLLGGRRRG